MLPIWALSIVALLVTVRSSIVAESVTSSVVTVACATVAVPVTSRSTTVAESVTSSTGTVSLPPEAIVRLLIVAESTIKEPMLSRVAPLNTIVPVAASSTRLPVEVVIVLSSASPNRKLSTRHLSITPKLSTRAAVPCSVPVGRVV